jgi:hypothetical protein
MSRLNLFKHGLQCILFCIFLVFLNFWIIFFLPYLLNRRFLLYTSCVLGLHPSMLLVRLIKLSKKIMESEGKKSSLDYSYCFALLSQTVTPIHFCCYSPFVLYCLINIKSTSISILFPHIYLFDTI